MNRKRAVSSDPWLPYEEARTKARALHLPSGSAYQEYCRQHPEARLPLTPEKVYRGKGWTTWYDFLGKATLSYEEACALVHPLQLPSMRAYIKYCRTHKDARLPSNPDEIYQGKGWTCWYAWLGRAAPEKRFLPFEEARALVRALHLPDVRAYREYCRRYKDARLPKDPSKTYQGKGWMCWFDFLGKARRKRRKDLLPYEEARAFVHTFHLPNRRAYYEYCRQHKQARLPWNPDRYYRGMGWTSWYDFLGKTKRKDLLPYEEARALVHALHLPDVKSVP